MQKKIVRLNVLSDETLDDFLESIGWHIFPKIEYDIKNFQDQIDQKNIKERENLVSDMLNYLKDKFMPFFNDYSSFPCADLNYLKRMVKIRRIDINKYFESTNAFSDAEDFLTTKLNPLFENVEKNIVEIDSQEKLMALLRKDWNGTEYINKYSHIEAVFTALAMYTSLRKQYRPHMREPEEIKSETKTTRLTAELEEYGFFHLPLVKRLSEQGKQDLVDLISSKDLPYGIAMFYYLDYLSHLEREHFKTKDALYKAIAKWLNANKSGRSVKGNISSFSKISTEDKTRYTAYRYKDIVKEDYQKLK
jgi:hypothetical protein